MHNIKNIFDKFHKIIFTILKDQVNEQGNFNKPGAKPKFSDIEIITLSLVSECLSIDSENYLFGKLKTEYRGEFPNLIDRSQYNLRRRKLLHKIEITREMMASKLINKENIFIIDSMPVEVCKLSRSTRSKICKETFETAPDKGFCSAQKTYFYGYKLHGICSLDGVFTSFDLTKASVHDIHYLQDVKEQISNAYLLGDKAYLSEKIQIDLFTYADIKLQTPFRTNQYSFIKQSFILRKSRKRIETLFSQLCDQFMIRRNYAKTFDGFRTRILSKLTALTILQFINKFFNAKPLNHIKYALAYFTQRVHY
jgi:hypothetical protein